MRYPTEQEFQAAIRAADNIEDKSRNTTKLLDYLSYFANNNPRIKGHINTRQTAIASWGWEITDAEGKKPPEAINTAIRLGKTIRRLINEVVYGSIYGWFAIDLRWQLVETDRIPNPQSIPVKFLEPMGDGSLAIKDKSGKRISQIQQNDPNFLFFNDGADSKGGTMRSLGLTEIMRADAIREIGNYVKKLKGIVQGIDRGADDQEIEIAKTALQTAMRENYMFSSDLVDFKYHNITGTPGTVFKDYLDYLNSSISIALLGQANTPQLPSGGGSRAALQVQQMVTADIMFADVELLENVVNDQLLHYDYLQNFGKTLSPWKFKVTLDDPVDYEASVIVVREALTAGVPLLKNEVYERIGFEMPIKGDDVFEAIPQSTGGF